MPPTAATMRPASRPSITNFMVTSMPAARWRSLPRGLRFAVGRARRPPLRSAWHRARPTAAAHAPMYWGGRWHQAQVFTPAAIGAGRRELVGPALIAEASSTTVIDPGWRGEVLSQGELLLERPAEPAPSEPTRVANRDRSDRCGRSDFARNLQPSVGRHRRRDGSDPAPHGQQRQREGAAGFQLRHLHRRRRPGGQRSPYPGPPGSDERNGATRAGGQSGSFGPATCW